jgi:acetoacetyl-CoA synthetase
MWNLVIGGLLAGATIVLHDGNPAHPDMNVLWEIAADTGVTFFGTSAAFVVANMKAGLNPAGDFDLSSVRTVGSTGSPLPPEGFEWLYDQFGDDLWLTSASGGTDVATAFIGGSPTLPVHAGELQCRLLGVAADAFDADGRSLVDGVGELVITRPMPSMPLYLWNDENGERYNASYFDMYPGVWRHGDWIRITPRGSAVILGRSDSTINRRGVRIGTAELYSAVEELPGIADSVCVDVGADATSSRLLLLVVPASGTEFDADAEALLRAHIRSTLSPRHVPDAIFVIPEVPRTLNGKKLEVPHKRLFQGVPLEEALNVDSMANPDSIGSILELAERSGGAVR